MLWVRVEKVLFVSGYGAAHDTLELGTDSYVTHPYRNRSTGRLARACQDEHSGTSRCGTPVPPWLALVPMGPFLTATRPQAVAPCSHKLCSNAAQDPLGSVHSNAAPRPHPIPPASTPTPPAPTACAQAPRPLLRPRILCHHLAPCPPILRCGSVHARQR